MKRTDADRQIALLDLSRRWRQYEHDLATAIPVVTETTAFVLGVERTSIWINADDGESSTCHDQFEATPKQHSSGIVAYRAHFPVYFEAMTGSDVVVAADAQSDPRNAEFVDTYLRPLGIGAMMLVPIRYGGKTVGVLSLEHVGGPRDFTTTEQNNAEYLAHLMSEAYDFQHRRDRERATEEHLSLLRATIQASGAGILAIDQYGSVGHYNQEFLDLWQMPEALMGKAGDGGPRVQHIANRGINPERVMQNWREVATDPTKQMIDVFETTDGRSIECRSLPQQIDRWTVGRVWSFRDVSYQRQIEQELRNLSMHDGLTGLFNRRCAEEHLEREIQRANRNKQALSVALLDLDSFKKLNDVHGHAVGDQVLRELAEDFKKRLRATDLPCRWGGEEFLLILPDTDEGGARTVINDFRKLIGRERRDIPSFTFSAGVAQYRKDQTPDALVDLADTRMYQAKQSGRNKVC